MTFPEAILPLKLSAILVSLLCGFMVGLERQISGKPAGIRTNSLICLGAYCFVAVGGIIQGTSDSTRIISQIITGIGFIGAGVIMTREKIIIGVTSAAVIWVLAGVGILIGLDRYLAAIFLSIITVIVLAGIDLLENFFLSLQNKIYKKLPSTSNQISDSENKK